MPEPHAYGVEVKVNPGRPQEYWRLDDDAQVSEDIRDAREQRAALIDVGYEPDAVRLVAITVVDPLALSPAQRVGMQVRSRHLGAFNRDEWGTIMSVRTPMDGVPCYGIRWPDGAADLWPVDDPDDVREFREPE